MPFLIAMTRLEVLGLLAIIEVIENILEENVSPKSKTLKQYCAIQFDGVHKENLSLYCLGKPFIDYGFKYRIKSYVLVEKLLGNEVRLQIVLRHMLEHFFNR